MSTGTPRTEPAQRPGLGARLRSFSRRALLMEARVYESIWRAITRRPAIAEGARGYSYHRPVLTVLMIFLVLSAVEIVILDLIVHRWLAVRIACLVIGIWGLTWMVGLLCAYLTRPHTVGPDGIRLREGMELDVPVAWDDFASIRLHSTAVDPSDPERPRGRVFTHDGEQVCAIRIGGETNLEIEFERPTTVHLPGLSPKGGDHTVTRIQFWADAPAEVMAAVRTHVP